MLAVPAPWKEAVIPSNARGGVAIDTKVLKLKTFRTLSHVS